jgi:SAM-dependent methyltransferase
VEFIGLDARQCTFVDLGCGKGRALLIAAQLGFRQVVGVEFAGELVRTAEQNLTKLKVTNGVVIHGDAAEYTLPPGNLLIYFNNPFGDEIMRRVLKNLGGRILHGPIGDIYVAYARPTCAALLDAAPFLQRLGTVPGRADITVWKVVQQWSGARVW